MLKTSPDTDPATDSARLDSIRLRSERAWQDARAAWARAQAIRGKLAMAPAVSPDELLTMSPLARLHARCATMPVIEQAKGVLMAQQGCDADGAFDLLRRASQRSNVPVRVLAEQIVQNAATTGVYLTHYRVAGFPQPVRRAPCACRGANPRMGRAG